MQVSVTFRNTGSESWFKDYATERLSKIQKYIDKPVEAHVVLSVEKFRNVAEVNIMAKGINCDAVYRFTPDQIQVIHENLWSRGWPSQ